MQLIIVILTIYFMATYFLVFAFALIEVFTGDTIQEIRENINTRTLALAELIILFLFLPFKLLFLIFGLIKENVKEMGK